ncbi:hypothetical protein DYB25_013104 [Aphanomyces astaci]|uniref:Uncharacterized protein n=1 Tax=Aphanomyces astaci TaxID=112090 RepID=A0A397A6X6_APHAT|nr:hypothetical protein DYB25_013104 [Aphanomyces astaci]
MNKMGRGVEIGILELSMDIHLRQMNELVHPFSDVVIAAAGIDKLSHSSVDTVSPGTLRRHPTRRPRPLAYTLWKTDFLSQARPGLAEFYSTKDFVPQGNRIDALNICKMYLELDQVEHSELYVVDPTLSETDRDARLAEIKAHTTAIQREVIAREATKKLANQRSAAHTFLVSAISTNLRRLYQATTCPFELFEHIKTRFESNPMDNNPTVIASYLRTLKFTDESCIDTLSVELIDLVKRYRVSMTPPSFNPLDPSAISSVDYHNHIWNYYTLSDTFIGDKELWEVVTNSVATARAANQSVLLLWVITALPLPFKREPSLQLSRMPLRPLRHHLKQLQKPMAQFML